MSLCRCDKQLEDNQKICSECYSIAQTDLMSTRIILLNNDRICCCGKLINTSGNMCLSCYNNAMLDVSYHKNNCICGKKCDHCGFCSVCYTNYIMIKLSVRNIRYRICKCGKEKSTKNKMCDKCWNSYNKHHF